MAAISNIQNSIDRCCEILKSNDVLIITGPTSSGKSDLALQVSNLTDALIVNADSVQAYKEIEILSASPEFNEKNRLYNFLLPDQEYNVIGWLEDVEKCVNDAVKVRQKVIIVGGSVMYIHHLIHGINEIPDVSELYKKQAQDLHDSMSYENFLAFIQKECDPYTPTDKHRAIRNLSFLLQYGKPLRECYKDDIKRYLRGIKVGKVALMPATPERREDLYNSCNTRFHDMLRDGAIDEVERIIAKYPKHYLGGASGFSHIVRHLKSEIVKKDMISLSQQHTRNYAKRQMTWIRQKFKDFVIFDINV